MYLVGKVANVLCRAEKILYNLYVHKKFDLDVVFLKVDFTVLV